jgi:hypothetical protein
VCAIAHELKKESLSKVLITRAGVGPGGEDEVVEWVVEIVDWNAFYVVANPWGPPVVVKVLGSQDVTRAEEEDTQVQDAAAVTLQIEMCVYTQTPERRRIHGTQQTVAGVVGNGQLGPALDLALCSSRVRKHQRVIITLQKGAISTLGPSLRPLPAPEEEIEEVQLQVYVQSVREGWSLTHEERLETVVQRRLQGNKQFHQGLLQEADETYLRALDLLFWEQGDGSADRLEVIQRERSKLLTNRAEVLLRQQEYREVVKVCCQVLEKDKCNVNTRIHMLEKDK